MDRSNQRQQNRNIQEDMRPVPLNTVPTYSLYGVSSAEPLADQLHLESIAARSRLYDWEIRPHKHEHFLQILYIQKGGGEALLEGRRQRLCGGSLITMPPGHVHGFQFSRGTDGIIVTMTGGYLRTLLGGVPDAVARLDVPRHDRISRRHALAGTLVLLRQQMKQPLIWRGAALSALLTLLLIEIARLAQSEGGGDARGRGRPIRHFDLFHQLLEGGYREYKDIGHYAAKIGVTETQLNRICRRLAGRSALQIIHARIVAEAQRDLLFSDLAVKQIAISLGFTDTNYFSRFFARITGQTPTAFRESGRGSLPAFVTRPGTNAPR
ncbi:helix-turn-helix domain-containing protein [Cupriavidus nantongensis]|uniref:helix-turn-helix domain-containing protein n=1 Tax=Cupriavidus nantongensis TaxID=1796606 RepID=UPI00358F1348